MVGPTVTIGFPLFSKIDAVAEGAAEPQEIGGTFIIPFTVTVPVTEQLIGSMAMALIKVPKLPTRPDTTSRHPVGNVHE